METGIITEETLLIKSKAVLTLNTSYSVSASWSFAKWNWYFRRLLKNYCGVCCIKKFLGDSMNVAKVWSGFLKSSTINFLSLKLSNCQFDIRCLCNCYYNINFSRQEQEERGHCYGVPDVVRSIFLSTAAVKCSLSCNFCSSIINSWLNRMAFDGAVVFLLYLGLALGVLGFAWEARENRRARNQDHFYYHRGT